MVLKQPNMVKHSERSVYAAVRDYLCRFVLIGFNYSIYGNIVEGNDYYKT
jgi:hypothetical protein